MSPIDPGKKKWRRRPRPFHRSPEPPRSATSPASSTKNTRTTGRTRPGPPQSQPRCHMGTGCEPRNLTPQAPSAGQNRSESHELYADSPTVDLKNPRAEPAAPEIVPMLSHASRCLHLLVMCTLLEARIQNQTSTYIENDIEPLDQLFSDDDIGNNLTEYASRNFTQAADKLSQEQLKIPPFLSKARLSENFCAHKCYLTPVVSANRRYLSSGSCVLRVYISSPFG